MLQQERGHRARQQEPIHGGAEHQPDERYRGRMGFQRPLDIPLAVQFVQATLDPLRVEADGIETTVLRRIRSFK